MDEKRIRTSYLIGEEALGKLWNQKVLVFGCGGVGGNAIEALARAGIGTIGIVDHDVVSVSNINRQLFATKETVGRKKVDVAEERIHAIDPDIQVEKYDLFYLPGNKDCIPVEQYDYVIDAIDTVTAKLDIIERCKEGGIPILSSMGCGNRMNPFLLKETDLFDTKEDPLAKVMRRECKKRGIFSLKVVYSTEKPVKNPNVSEELPEGKRSVPGSSPFVPPAAGIMIASIVVRDLLGNKKEAAL